MMARIQDLHRLLDRFKETEESYGLDLRLDLSRIIVERLQAMRWTQSQLAAKLGMKEAQVSRLVHGDANCTFKTAARILHALGVRPKLEAAAVSAPVQRRAARKAR